MAITPTGQIILLNVPIEIDNKNQLTFSSESTQYTYFLSRKVSSFEYSDCSYLRKDSILKVPAHIDNLYNVNYLMYRNRNFSSKWFYAFITKKEYVSDNCTALTIKTDCYQTWQFNIDIKPSFVVREMLSTSDDVVGANVLPENLQLGEYVCNKFDKLLHNGDSALNTNTDLSIVVAATLDTSGSGFSDVGTQVDGIFQGVNYFCFHNRTGGVSDTSGIEALNVFLRDYATQGKLDYIQSIFMIPSFACQGAEDRQDHKYVGSNLVYNKYVNAPSHSDNKNMDFSLTTIDGYTPKNQKLKTYPFAYLLVSNCSGTDVPYRFEDFYTITDNVKTIVTPSFRVQSCMTPSGSIRMLPLNYKGQETNAVEGMNLGKFPVCSWTGDSYTNWLTQNGVNIGLSVAGSLLSTGSAVATGNPIGVAGGILGVANTLGEIHKESIAPLQSEGNINCGDVVTASGQNDFRFQVMTIKSQFAKIIDEYFSTYGYSTNRVKVPNTNNRSNWNYVETRNIDITGKAPQEDVQEIKNMFDNGVTLWHNPNTFGDYSQSNT